MAVHTIGEVLNQLREEFDDVTISRIRSLESQGLISPDRTDSGYRKFSEHDIDRIRYVLTAHRDRQVDLEVIRRELDRMDAGLPPQSDDAATVPGESTTHANHQPRQPRKSAKTSRHASGRTQTPNGALQLPLDGDDSPLSPPPEPNAGSPDHSRLDDPPGGRQATRAQNTTAPPQPASAPASDLGPFVDEIGDLRLTDSELADATGLTLEDVKGLREHGILGPEALSDASDVELATIAAELLAAGLEPRHLRMYRQFAQREAGLLEQLMSPLLRQRNPESRQRALVTGQRLAELGAELQRRLLDEEIQSTLRSWR
ncbi:MAG: MerR family transcriptional regulator [Nitriliruptoraceae bacterium]